MNTANPDQQTSGIKTEHASETVRMATEAYPIFDRARERSVRLVISIPVLILLIVLGPGTFLYGYLNNIAREPVVSDLARNRIERVADVALWLSIGIGLIASVIGYIVARQIVRPIKELRETMEAISEGDFTTKIHPLQLGEFGQLGTTFNRMVEQLNRLFQERDRQLRETFNGAHLVVDRREELRYVEPEHEAVPPRQLGSNT